MANKKFLTKKIDKICRKCPYVSHPFVPGYGNPDADILFVARDPGANEEEEGKPLVGKSGQVFNVCLESAGLKRSDVFCTNVLRCRPPDNVANTPEWRLAAKKCRKYLDYEIKKVNPRVIVTMGNEAFKEITGKSGKITQIRGSVVQQDGRKIIPIFHPAYVLRKEPMTGIFCNDLMQVHKESLSTKLTTRGKGFKHTVVDDIQKFNDLCHRVMMAKDCEVDVETDKIEWWNDAVVICLSICLEDDHSYVIPFRNYSVKTVQEVNPETGRKRKRKVPVITPYWPEKGFKYIVKRLSSVLGSPSLTKVFHNAKFDMHHLWNEGIKIRKLDFDDTLVMQHLVNEQTPRDLKSLAAMYAPHMAGYEREIRAQEEYSHSLVAVKPEIMWEYCSGDTVATRHVKNYLIDEMENQGVSELYRDLSKPLLRLLFRMERIGVLIGKRELQETKTELERQITEKDSQLFRIVGKEFNPDSPIQLSKILFKERNLPVYKTTAKGAASTDREVLEVLAKDDQLCAALVDRRSLSKLYGTYVKGLEKRLDKSHRLHTTFRQARTTTGRLSSSDPNLQNIPKKGPIKKMFIAPPGYLLCASDLSQVELRVLAILSGDRAMIEAFASGLDFHQTVAEMIFKKKDIEPVERSAAKVINFSVVYLKSEEAAAADAGVPVEVMKKYFEDYFRRFPKLKKAMKDIPDLAMKQGYLVNPFGRRERFDVEAAEQMPGGIGHLRRQAINFPPQSTASDINCFNAIRIQDRFDRMKIKAHVIIMVHDSVISIIPIDKVKTCTKIIHEEMTRPVKEMDNHSFPCEIGVGSNWQEAEDDMHPFDP